MPSMIHFVTVVHFAQGCSDLLWAEHAVRSEGHDLFVEAGYPGKPGAYRGRFEGESARQVQFLEDVPCDSGFQPVLEHNRHIFHTDRGIGDQPSRLSGESHAEEQGSCTKTCETQSGVAILIVTLIATLIVTVESYSSLYSKPYSNYSFAQRTAPKPL